MKRLMLALAPLALSLLAPFSRPPPPRTPR